MPFRDERGVATRIRATYVVLVGVVAVSAALSAYLTDSFFARHTTNAATVDDVGRLRLLGAVTAAQAAAAAELATPEQWERTRSAWMSWSGSLRRVRDALQPHCRDDPGLCSAAVELGRKAEATRAAMVRLEAVDGIDRAEALKRMFRAHADYLVAADALSSRLVARIDPSRESVRARVWISWLLAVVACVLGIVVMLEPLARALRRERRDLDER
jgi:hypothetical protein